MSGENFELELSGVSGCQFTGEADPLDVTLSGASTVRVHATEELIAGESGASTFRYTGKPTKLNQ